MTKIKTKFVKTDSQKKRICFAKQTKVSGKSNSSKFFSKSKSPARTREKFSRNAQVAEL